MADSSSNNTNSNDGSSNNLPLILGVTVPVATTLVAVTAAITGYAVYTNLTAANSLAPAANAAQQSTNAFASPVVSNIEVIPHHPSVYTNSSGPPPPSNVQVTTLSHSSVIAPTNTNLIPIHNPN